MEEWDVHVLGRVVGAGFVFGVGPKGSDQGVELRCARVGAGCVGGGLWDGGGSRESGCVVHDGRLRRRARNVKTVWLFEFG